MVFIWSSLCVVFSVWIPVAEYILQWTRTSGAVNSWTSLLAITRLQYRISVESPQVNATLSRWLWREVIFNSPGVGLPGSWYLGWKQIAKIGKISERNSRGGSHYLVRKCVYDRKFFGVVEIIRWMRIFLSSAPPWQIMPCVVRNLF